jgi:hypothetical protein
VKHERILKLVASRPSERTDCVRANAVPAPPLSPLRAEPVSRLGALRIDRLSHTTIRPIFTSRTHYGAPKPRGHRQFTGPQRGWE